LRPVNTLSRLIVSTGSALAIAACGGGGGDSSGNSSQPTAEITSASAPVVAGAVMKNASQGEVFGSLAGFTTPTIAASGELTLSAIKSLHAKTGTLAPTAASSETTPCAVSGTVTFSSDTASADTLAAGDRITFAYEDCDQGDGAILNGGFELTVRTFQGDAASGSMLMTVDLVANDFGMLQGEESSTIDGDLRMALDTREANAFRIEVSGDALDVGANGEFASLADFSIAITMDTTLGTSTLDIGGYLMSSAFNGDVRYDTIQPLEVDAAGVPTAGEIRITGAKGATVEVNILGAENVQLDIDLNGDGTVDEVVTLSWTELTS
jgi:hypothetical protein